MKPRDVAAELARRLLSTVDPATGKTVAQMALQLVEQKAKGDSKEAKKCARSLPEYRRIARLAEEDRRAAERESA